MTYKGILFPWHFTDIRPKGNEIAFWGIGDTKHVPRKNVPRHLPRSLQIPYVHRIATYAGEKTAVGGHRHADIWPQVRRSDAGRTIAPAAYLRTGTGIVHHILAVGEVVGNDVRAVLGPLE